MQLENIEPTSPPRRQAFENELDHPPRTDLLRKDRFLSDGHILLPEQGRMWNEFDEKSKKPRSPHQELKGSPKQDPMRTNKKSQKLQSSPPGHDHKTKSGKKGKRNSDEENRDGLGELLDMHRSNSEIYVAHSQHLTPTTQDLFIGNNKFLKSPYNHMQEEERYDHSKIIKMLGSGDTGALNSSNKKKNKISSFFGSSDKKRDSPVYTSNFLEKLEDFQAQSPTFGPKKTSQKEPQPVVRRLTTTFSFTEQNNTMPAYELNRTPSSRPRQVSAGVNSGGISIPEIARFDLDYRAMSTLGKTYASHVYKCQNKLDGLVYAIKIFKQEIHPELLRQVHEALAVVARNDFFENLYLVRFFCGWIEDKRLHVAFEYCEGSLDSLVKDKQLVINDNTVRVLLRSILEGLDLIHKNKLAHQGIHPGNLFYSTTGKYKLGDVGLSFLRHVLCPNGEDHTSRYTAPELLAKNGIDSLQNSGSSLDLLALQKADIYSLGITIRDLISKHDRLEDTRTVTTCDLVKMKLPGTRFSCTVQHILNQMVHENPDKRPSCETILKNFLLTPAEFKVKLLKMEVRNLQKEKVGLLEQLGKKPRKYSS